MVRPIDCCYEWAKRGDTEICRKHYSVAVRCWVTSITNYCDLGCERFSRLDIPSYYLDFLSANPEMLKGVATRGAGTDRSLRI
jgi:hypothetical protein